MADNIIDLSTAGVTVGYAVEATAGTRPTTGYKAILGIKSIPEINSQPETLDTTTLAATEYKTSINGLKDLGGALAFGANLTEASHTQWKEIYQAWVYNLYARYQRSDLLYRRTVYPGSIGS